MFEFLFKYPMETFSDGTLLLSLSAWQLALLPLGVFALAYVALGYLSIRRRLALRDRLAITGLRSLALTLVILCMTRPLLEVNTAMAQPGVVGVLLDNSLSMTVEDGVRSHFVRTAFAADGGDLLRRLQTRFDTKLFKYGAATDAIDSVDRLDFGDGSSDLGAALRHTAELLRGEPLAALVVIGDGAAGDDTALEVTLRRLRAAGIAIHSVGLGSTHYQRDVELGPVHIPRRALLGSRVMAEVPIRQQGYTGQSVELRIEDDGRILHKQQITLDSTLQTLRVPLTIEDSGTRALKVLLPAFDDEQITANNLRRVISRVDQDAMRFLYFEGEPRFEFKFLRRAVADDDKLQIAGLVRTADAKFYRVGIESETELRDGFPLTADELFAYDALILGSVEISLLSPAQQQMIVDFVSRRGGGLLLLGGRHAFAEGGYADSVIRELMPVVLAEQAQPDFTRQIKVQPSAAAWEHPALQLDENQEQSIARWRSLPRLTLVNPLQRIKPGASLLLTSRAGDQDDPYVALATQQFGRGKVVAFAVQNSWLWQMHHQIELDDTTHERLWRQLLRWLVEEIPPPVSLDLAHGQTHVGGRIQLRSEAFDQNFNPLAAAAARAIVTLPDGREQISPLTRHPTLAGVYQTDLEARVAGDYWVRVELDHDGQTLSSAEARFRAEPNGTEFFDSQLNEPLLRHIADATGGRYFNAEDAAGLPAAIDTDQRTTTRLARLELWDMPVILLLLVAFLCAEWAYRRWRGTV